MHDVERQIRESLAAVRSTQRRTGAQVLAIYSNNDAGGKRIVARLKKSDFMVFPHIVYEDYLRLLKHAHVLVGNSSAGIHEAPSYGLPAVDIGTRQQYREKGRNVIEVPNRRALIERALYTAMTDTKLRAVIKHAKNPYDQGRTAHKVVRILETIELPNVQKVLSY